MIVLPPISRLACALVVAGLLWAPLGASTPRNAPTKAATAKAVLNLGDPAPRIKVARWLKGQPVTTFKKGEVYVLEFWATWCGPCKAAIPHITELSKKYAGKVTFIGLNVWEGEKNPKVLDQKLDEFVAKMGEKMGYTVAQDSRDGFMSKAWMKAAGQEGIPASFIVGKDGRIQWIGSPENLERVLEKIFSGTFSLEEVQAEAKRQSELAADMKAAEKVLAPSVPAIERAIEAKDWAQVLKLVDQVQATAPDSKGLKDLLLSSRLVALANSEPAKVYPMLEAALTDAKAGNYLEAAQALMNIQDLDKRWSELALSYLDKATALVPQYTQLLVPMRFGFLLRIDEAKAQDIFEAAKANAELRGSLIGIILRKDNVSKQWLEKVVPYLEASANAPEGERNFPYLAKAYFGLDRAHEAAAVQEKCVAFLRVKKAPKSDQEGAEATLKIYRAAIK